ncbi:MAG TPA: membrane protein insertase YidC [Thermohalobaculum sp.]|nr:membrane protein insertase YidC [Thermohalobaculum sp.]
MGGDIDNRNLILAAVLAMLVIIGWQAFFAPPPPPPELTEEVENRYGPEGEVAPLEAVPQGGVPDRETRADVLGQTARIPVESGAVSGSLSLRGGRLDDLKLSLYRETLLPGSDTVTLLSPLGGPSPYYVVYGWVRSADSDPGPLPDANTEWRIEDGDTLTPATPVTLAWDNGEGLIFRRKMEIDDRYMLTVTQSVENTTGEPVNLAPYGYVARRGEPDTIGFFILHEGAVGEFDGKLSEVDYDDMLDLPLNRAEGGRAEATRVAGNGFLGFTGKYFMTALAGGPEQPFEAVHKSLLIGDTPEFRTEMRLPLQTVAPGGRAESSTYLFAGAKEVATLRDYIEDHGIEGFDDAVDWGWFYFLTKPIFNLLMFVNGLIGNMGWSIIVLTLIIKAALFPLAYKSYVSMSKMKKLQPEMEKLKERAGDDRQKLQQEMMALYKNEKVNPAAGCLPILLQIPIFFSLYKVLFVTIEMRHAPFIAWIDDLSAPDPTSWINLFGLLPYDVSWAPVFISIGVFPILMGVTMWMQQKLNPEPTDPTQAMIFAWMPWLFMFMLGSFASGLVIYWCANNIITFVQQYAIMRSQGVEVDFLGNVKRSLKRKPPVKGEKPSAKAKPETPAKAPSDEPGAEGEPPAAAGEDEAPAEDQAAPPAPQAKPRSGRPASDDRRVGAKGKKRRRGGSR